MITKDIWIIRHHTYIQLLRLYTIAQYIYILLDSHKWKSRRARITKWRDQVTYKITWLYNNRTKYFQYELIMTWFVIRDHVQQNICDEIYEKIPLLKNISKTVLYTCSYYIYAQLFIVIVYIYTKLFLRCWFFLNYKCFDKSSPLLQIRSQLVVTIAYEL